MSKYLINLLFVTVSLFFLTVTLQPTNLLMFAQDTVTVSTPEIDSKSEEPFVSPLSSGYEPRHIVDMPNAGMLKRMNYSIGLQMISEGGFVFDFNVAPLSFLNLGISYGGSGIVGSGDIEMQYIPGFHIKGRILNETSEIPAIVAGFNSQGRGHYFRDNRRFEEYSPGFYVAASKCFLWELGELSLHAGLNYSIDRNSNGINAYCGFEQIILKFVSLNFELNPNLNEPNNEIWDGKMLLNASVKFKLTKNIMFEMQFRDLLQNSKYSDGINRFVSLEYIGSF